MLEMFKGVANSPETTITNNISNLDTIIYVLDETRIPADLPNLMVLGTGTGAETVKVLSIADNAITVERGFQGVAKAWNAGTIIARNFTEYDYNALLENVNEVDTRIGPIASLLTRIKTSIINALNGVQEDLDEHKADLASQEINKGANLIGIHDANALFASTNVEGALDELFQSVSNGKSLIAGAITDKGVITSSSDSFSVMAGNIGEISSGGVELIAGDNTLYIDTVFSELNRTVTPMKTHDITFNESGTVRISFDLRKTYTGNYLAYGQIYKNEVPYGILRSTQNVTLTKFTEDFAISKNDTIQLYIHVENIAVAASVTNFAISADTKIITVNSL